MGNNNLNENQQTQETQVSEQTNQQQGQTTSETQGTNDNSNVGEPTLAQMMKELAEAKVDIKRLKKANDSLASENAGLRKQVNAKLTEEELRAQKDSEEKEAFVNELKELRNEVALTKATKRYMSMGMSEEMATKLAQSELDGDMDTVTSGINTFVQAQKKEEAERVTAELYAKMPTPLSGNGDGQIDYEKQYQEKLASGDIAGAISAQLMASAQKAQ